MSKAYAPSTRNDAMVVKYMVKTAGDRWFIPYNDNDTKADQVTQCSQVVGNTNDGTVAGAETVGSYTATVTPKTAPLM